jgi:hypothetical protein
VAETLLRHPNQPGIVEVRYDKQHKEAVSDFIPAGAAKAHLPANENQQQAVPAAAPAANAAFKPK